MDGTRKHTLVTGCSSGTAGSLLSVPGDIGDGHRTAGKMRPSAMPNLLSGETEPTQDRQP